MASRRTAAASASRVRGPYGRGSMGDRPRRSQPRDGSGWPHRRGPPRRAARLAAHTDRRDDVVAGATPESPTAARRPAAAVRGRGSLLLPGLPRPPLAGVAPATRDDRRVDRGHAAVTQALAVRVTLLYADGADPQRVPGLLSRSPGTGPVALPAHRLPAGQSCRGLAIAPLDAVAPRRARCRRQRLDRSGGRRLGRRPATALRGTRQHYARGPRAGGGLL